MSKIRAIGLPVVCASLVAAGAISVTWLSAKASEGEKPSADQTVQAFMALGTSSKKSVEATKNTTAAPTEECVPCAQKGTAPVAGRVPSRPPPHPIDGDYERITGRARNFALPAEAGSVSRATDQPRRGWMMVITGAPIRQTNCYVEMEQGQFRLSRVSGALRLEPTIYPLNGNVAALEPDARLLVESIRTFLSAVGHALPKWERDQRIADWTVVSATAHDVYAVPTGVAWTVEAQQDLRIRLSSTGRINQLEHVLALLRRSPLVASRVVWFPEYEPPR